MSDILDGLVERPEDVPGPDPAEAVDVADGTAEPQPVPLGVDVATTGNAEVDTVLQRLSDADELPTQGHIDVYEDVHGALRDVLTALDSRPGPPPPPRSPVPGPGIPNRS